MTITVRPYADGDLDRVKEQPWQKGERIPGTEDAPHLGPAFTVEREGRLLLVAGLAEVHDQWASAWAVFSTGLGKDYTSIVRGIRAVMASSKYRRIDALVRDDWDRGHALARLLGFSKEGVKRASGPKGEDFALYAIVRGND